MTAPHEREQLPDLIRLVVQDRALMGLASHLFAAVEMRLPPAWTDPPTLTATSDPAVALSVHGA